MGIISNNFFWLNVILIIWSTSCYNASLRFNGTNLFGKSALSYIGSIGIGLGLIRCITLSIHFEWWWFIPILITSGLIGSTLFALILFVIKKDTLFTILGFLGIVGIPIVWWLGGMF